MGHRIIRTISRLELHAKFNENLWFLSLMVFTSAVAWSETECAFVIISVTLNYNFDVRITTLMSRDLEVLNIWIFRISEADKNQILLNVSWTSEYGHVRKCTRLCFKCTLRAKGDMFGNRNCADIWSTLDRFGCFPNRSWVMTHDPQRSNQGQIILFKFHSRVIKDLDYSWKYLTLSYLSIKCDKMT